MTYREALRRAGVLLRESGVAEAEQDAWILMEYCTGIGRAQYFLVQQEQMTQAQQAQYEALTARRAQRIPVQHLTGTQAFMGLEFAVNAHVLIPRQDTEVLAEEALKRLPEGSEVLDLCTGSGCLAVSLKKLAKRVSVSASDISAKALAVARENARRNEAEVAFYESDLFAKVPGCFDMIVSNPPYIATDEIAKLMPEVREHEPVTALDGAADGLMFYRKITAEVPGHLRPGGWLLFEIGCDQGDAVAGLLRGAGFSKVEVKKDYAGLDRVALGRLGRSQKQAG